MRSEYWFVGQFVSMNTVFLNEINMEFPAGIIGIITKYNEPYFEWDPEHKHNDFELSNNNATIKLQQTNTHHGNAAAVSKNIIHMAISINNLLWKHKFYIDFR